MHLKIDLAECGKACGLSISQLMLCAIGGEVASGRKVKPAQHAGPASNALAISNRVQHSFKLLSVAAHAVLLPEDARTSKRCLQR